MPIDGRRSVRRNDGSYGIYDGAIDSSNLNPPISSEIKDGQWLGVEVQSQGQGGKVIVCAHRYTVRDILRPNSKPVDTKRGMIGLCYILDSSLKVPQNDVMGYKNVMVIRDAVGGKRLEPKGNFDDHAEWGVCQVGAAATFVEDVDGGGEDIALFGAPGCFTWRGNILAQHVGSLQRYDIAVNRDSFRKFAKHGLMGVAVTSGRFFNNKVYYVSGAPHANSTGQVYFFSKDASTGLLAPQHYLTLQGEDYGAGFGLSLASCDLNGDGSPDLVVGAPFYADETSGAVRGGAIYLFQSQNGKLGQLRRIKIVGRELLSQFGLSVTCMGDMNGDGFEDIAVGAPYEVKGGSVFIIFGGGFPSTSNVFMAEEVAEQVITARDMTKHASSVLPYGLKTFGSSLSGGQDMDDNGYPDLVVGAYASSAVFLIRARPIIGITTYVDDRNLVAIDPGQSGCPEDPTSKDSCFAFSACFKVSREASQHSHSLRFHIEAEPQKPISRVYLRLPGSQNNEKNSSVEDTVVMLEAGRQQCTNILGYVGSTHLDLQTPVQFQMSYSLVQAEPTMAYNSVRPLPDMADFPILNQAEAKKRFQATFEKDCGADDICNTHLVLSPTLRDKTKELSRTPTGESYELELGSLEGSELVLDVEVANRLEPAYEATLDIYFPPSVHYVGVGTGDNDNDVVNADLKNATWLSVSLGNPFKNTTKMQLRFKPQADMEDRLMVFYLSANTSSVLLYDASTFVNLAIVRRAEVKVHGKGFPDRLHYGGPVLGENAFADISEVGPQLVQKFQVINNGPSMLDVLTLHIQWPFQVENGSPVGKWLFYLSEHPTLKNGRGVCYLPPGYTANPLNLTSSSPDKYGHYGRGLMKRNSVIVLDRPKRSSSASKVWVEKVVSPRTIPDQEGRDLRIITLDCDRGTAKCLHIKCDLYNLPVKVSATVEVRGRLWNSTLMEDYGSGIDFVEIFTKAAIEVDRDISQYVGDDFLSIKTLVYADIARQRPLAFPDWWIILISILAGLLVLVIISSILWKLGFFERKRPTEDDDSDLMMSAHFEKVRLNSDY